MISLFTSKLEEIDLGTFLSRADVARMRQIWLSSCYPLSIRGGISAFKYISYMYFSHCVLLSTLTYAPSPTPLITFHLTHTSLIINTGTWYVSDDWRRNLISKLGETNDTVWGSTALFVDPTVEYPSANGNNGNNCNTAPGSPSHNSHNSRNSHQSQKAEHTHGKSSLGSQMSMSPKAPDSPLLDHTHTVVPSSPSVMPTTDDGGSDGDGTPSLSLYIPLFTDTARMKEWAKATVGYGYNSSSAPKDEIALAGPGLGLEGLTIDVTDPDAMKGNTDFVSLDSIDSIVSGQN